MAGLVIKWGGGRSYFHILLKWGSHYKMLWGVKSFKNCKVTPPTIKHKRVVLKRLQVLTEQVYPESQCGFRANRSTIDMIFSLKQLQEKCREQKQPLFVAFIDLTKAFDLVSRDGLFRILPKIGCPPKLLSIIRSFHEDMKGTVIFDGSTPAAFNIRSGVKQGCVLAPTLFGIFFAVMLKHAFGHATEGIYLRTRTDEKLFNLSRLRAKTKV